MKNLIINYKYKLCKNLHYVDPHQNGKLQLAEIDLGGFAVASQWSAFF